MDHKTKMSISANEYMLTSRDHLTETVILLRDKVESLNKLLDIQQSLIQSYSQSNESKDKHIERINNMMEEAFQKFPEIWLGTDLDLPSISKSNKQIEAASSAEIFPTTPTSYLFGDDYDDDPTSDWDVTLTDGLQDEASNNDEQ